MGRVELASFFARICREIGDQIEVLLGEEYKPFPNYEDLLYSVQ